MIIEFQNNVDFELSDAIVDSMKTIATMTLLSENFKKTAEISITIVDNVEIRELNKKHRHIDKITDVLSFPMYDIEDGIFTEIYKEKEPILLGDIVISIEKAREQAEEYGHTILRELAFLTVHSMLHLLGYDHENQRDSEIMFRKQEEILTRNGIHR